MQPRGTRKLFGLPPRLPSLLMPQRRVIIPRTFGFRNGVRRNGGFEVWQRGAGGAASIAVAASSTVQVADGWYYSTGANEASVVSQQAGLSNGSRFSLKALRNNGQNGTTTPTLGFSLDTDELYPFLGRTVALTFTAKAGANWSPAGGLLSFFVVVGTGTPIKYVVGFTGMTSALSGSASLTTSSKTFTFRGSVIVPTTTRQMEVSFFFTPVGVAGADDSYTIDDVMLEPLGDFGQEIGMYEHMQFQEHIMLCLRHFQKSFPYSTAPATNFGANNNAGEIQWNAISATLPNQFQHRLYVPLRTVPTVTLFNPSAVNAQIRNITDTADWSGSTTGQNTNLILFGGVVNAGHSAGDTIGVAYTADAAI